ncbi:MAG: hypothetical protein AAGK00_18700 [Pseudomonadota bacterium]
MRIPTLAALGFVAALAACGTTTTERAISGGAIGAGAGAAGALVTGSDVSSGLLLGGLVGAAAGALTDADDIYLGEAPFQN